MLEVITNRWALYLTLYTVSSVGFTRPRAEMHGWRGIQGMDIEENLTNAAKQSLRLYDMKRSHGASSHINAG
jgi:hypothetical protein